MDAVKYAAEINAAASRYQLPPALVAAVVATESAFNPQAYRNEPQIGDASRGLMQLLLATARSLGYDGSPLGLYDVATNLGLGAKLLRRNFDTARARDATLPERELWDRALSAYNAGFSTVRPGDAKRDAAGRLINPDYVARVRRWWERFGGPAAGSSPLGALAVALIAGTALYYGRRVPSSDR